MIVRDFGELTLEIGILLFEILAHPKQIDAVVLVLVLLLMLDLPGLYEVPHILLREREVPWLDALLKLHYPHHLLHSGPGLGKHQDPVPVGAGDEAVRRQEADLVLPQERVVVVVGEPHDSPLRQRAPGVVRGLAYAHVRLAPAPRGAPVPLRPGRAGERLRWRGPGAVAHEVPPGQPPAHAVLPLRPVPPDREPAPPREPAVELVRRVVGREPLPDVGNGVVGVTLLARLRGGRRRLRREPRLVGGVVLPAGVALQQRCGFRGRHPWRLATGGYKKREIPVSFRGGLDERAMEVTARSTRCGESPARVAGRGGGSVGSSGEAIGISPRLSIFSVSNIHIFCQSSVA